MPTRSLRTLPIVVVGIVVVTSFAATGIGYADQKYEHGTHSHHGAELSTSTSDAFDSPSSPKTVLSTLSSVTSIVLLAGYPRGSDPLDHDVRKEIHDRIHRTSGIYVSDLQSDLQEDFDIHRSTLRYHLQILEREGLVSSESIFGKCWCHSPECDATELRAALANGATGEIVDAIARLEPVSVTTLASEVERSPSTISYHLDRLEDNDLVEQEQRSTTVLSRLTPDVRTELRTSTNWTDSARE